MLGPCVLSVGPATSGGDRSASGARRYLCGSCALPRSGVFYSGAPYRPRVPITFSIPPVPPLSNLPVVGRSYLFPLLLAARVLALLLRMNVERACSLVCRVVQTLVVVVAWAVPSHSLLGRH